VREEGGRERTGSNPGGQARPVAAARTSPSASAALRSLWAEGVASWTFRALLSFASATLAAASGGTKELSPVGVEKTQLTTLASANFSPAGCCDEEACGRNPARPQRRSGCATHNSCFAHAGMALSSHARPRGPVAVLYDRSGAVVGRSRALPGRTLRSIRSIVRHGPLATRRTPPLLRPCMSAAPVAYEVHASRAAAERALLSYSSTLLLARAAGCSVPAMRLQLLRVRARRAHSRGRHQP